ncbi:DUF1638 domain-containing protein [Maritimibacter sp. HL-12]|uniref:DUF1638 domain-containing protein n=1 Tax=Maritimibacter sp. HL-12 TaxID=1162418 RepID=UPI000A0F2F4C|nr:DUF1638 domain-containing protein [Maritimibacter sp. HL-12]SMH58111.1 Protein of unknown function [Maritimibacter sp. HL-12]
MKPGTETDDARLTAEGLAARGNGRVLVIGCGALAREILAVLEANGLSHVDLACLPAILHNRPEKIHVMLEEAILKHRDTYETIFVAYADCGSGGKIAEVCARHGVAMLEGPHCYSFFEGNAAFAARDEVTAFYLTDFLTRQFEAFVIKPLGLDRHPELRDAYFGNYEKLVYLAQADDPALDVQARAAAERLGLAYERRFTGYGDLAPALKGL